MQCRLRDRRSRLFSLGLRPCPLRTEIPPDSLNLLIMLCIVEGEISKSLPIFLWGTLFLNISIIFSRICWQTGDPLPIFAPKGLDLSWTLLLYQIIITITCWHQLFQNTSLFNQFTSLLALNCSCPNFFWNVLQVWMTGKDVYLQMTWSWPDKTWNILCSYCLQWNASQSKFRNHYFLFLFAFSILSQLFLIWGCTCVYVMKKKDGAWDRKRGGHVWEQLKLTVYGCERHEHWASETLLSSVLHKLQKTFPLPALPGREVLSDLTNSWGPFCPKYTHSPDDKVRLFSVPLHSQHTYLCGRLALKQPIFYIIMS